MSYPNLNEFKVVKIVYGLIALWNTNYFEPVKG